MIEYSPNQISDNDSPVNINGKNLTKLMATANEDDTLSIAFIGDSQRFYDDVELFVDRVNKTSGVDLVIIAGDISDFGLLAEFEWIARRLNKLNKPYISVIGNHDVIANGEAVFKRSFGPLDFSFVYDSVKFVVHNTNSREYTGNHVPDLEWLADELRPSPDVKHFIGVSHVPPFDGDFNKSLEDGYSHVLSSTPGFLVSLHGHVHRHTDGYPYEDGVRYITSHYFPERQFILLKIHRGSIYKTFVKF
jgi:3',5'-cyclic-AMP phosphodiesterase